MTLTNYFLVNAFFPVFKRFTIPLALLSFTIYIIISLTKRYIFRMPFFSLIERNLFLLSQFPVCFN